MPWYGPAGEQLHYEEAGDGDTVVLLPGWGSSITDLDRLRAVLSDGFRVIAIDLPGSGRSEPQPRRYTRSYYHDDARTILALLDGLDVTTAHLAGFSDGGEEALLLAELRPGLALSVLTWGAAGRIEATPRQLNEIAEVIDHPVPDLMALAAYLAEAYGPQNARIMTCTWADAMRGIVEDGGDISRLEAAQISCPALLITGSYDTFCPPELVRPMAALIPRGEFREAVGAGHDVHHSHHDWIAGVLSDWLAAH
jgi:pimeloyl-ACP methyl ester carboxylesterase